LGSPSRIANVAGAPSPGNHPADATIDELYVWKDSPLSNPKVDPRTPWLRGRYYVPQGSNEGSFTSQVVSLVPSGARVLPPASSVLPPPGSAVVPPLSSVGGTSPQVRVLGISWTWYGEPVDPTVTPLGTWDGKPVLYTYQEGGVPIKNVLPKIEIDLLDGKILLKGQTSAGGDWVTFSTSGGSIPVILNPGDLRYNARVILQDSDFSTLLLATPVLDDVTLYWDEGRPRLVSYMFDMRSF
jgi:hypothetical protein